MLQALTIEQFSQATGISPQTVRRQIRLGQLPAARVGRRYFVPADWLDRIVRAPTQSTPKTQKAPPQRGPSRS